MKEQLESIWQQQWLMAWENFVHEMLPDKRSATQERRRHLIFDLSEAQKAVPINKIAEISPRIAREYARKSHKTLIRDLNALIELKLLEKDSKEYKARIETILEFRPT